MKEDANYIVLTDANFEREVLDSCRPILVFFEAGWCGNCHIVAPTVERLAVQYRGQVEFGKLDIDENKAVPEKYGVWNIPAVLSFEEGQAVGQITGTFSREQLETCIQLLLEG